METIGAFITAQNGVLGTTYAVFSLMGLIARIVHAGDETALREFLEHRRVFRWGTGPVIGLPAYMFALRNAYLDRAHAPGFRLDVVDRAYDITLDKFSQLPAALQDMAADPNRPVGTVPAKCIDCRHYYRAFLKYCSMQGLDNMPALERERRASFLLQRFLLRHFFFSLLEGSRQLRPDVHRYTWSVNGKKICLYMPRAMSGKKKCEWLTHNIEAADLNAGDCRDRIQDIIKQRLWPEYTNAAATTSITAGGRNKIESPLSWSTVHGVTTQGFARILGEEKAAAIKDLRPSIRILGPERLKSLILALFEELEAGDYEAGRLARRFGLSESSLSRFAGGQWNTEDSPTYVPDLWRNMANLIGKNTDFIDAAQAAGVWDVISPLMQKEVTKK
jgi:hypothetical protein